MSQPATFSHRTQITPTAWSYFFTTKKPVVFIPGQYLRWTAPIAKDLERGNKRFFTISSLPGESLISFTTRFLKPISPFKTYLQDMNPGDVLEVSNPMGDFTLPENSTTPVVLVAGGIGITPFRSMVHESLVSSPERLVSLVHGAKDALELAFRDEFMDFATHSGSLTCSYYSDVPDPSTVSGHITTGELLSGAPKNCIFYISGPEPFVEAQRLGLIAAGIDENAIRSDYFPGYAEI